MTVWDVLLEWMTHLGYGGWEAFRDAVNELENKDIETDERGTLRTLRVTLSDLGHTDFFVGGSRRWQTLRPAIVGLCSPAEHVFVGGRTRSLREQLRAKLPSRTTLTVTEMPFGPSRIHILGDPDVIASAAESIAVEYVPNVAAMICGQLQSIRAALETAPPSEEPINWSVRSWSFSDARWIDAKLDRTVREYSNRHGVRRFFIHVGRSGLREIEKRASIYCAALIRGLRIVHYSYNEQSLHVPRWAPLPAMYARAACLCGGRLGTVDGDSIVFGNVDPEIASSLLVALGQGLSLMEAKR